MDQQSICKYWNHKTLRQKHRDKSWFGVWQWNLKYDNEQQEEKLYVRLPQS